MVLDYLSHCQDWLPAPHHGMQSAARFWISSFLNFYILETFVGERTTEVIFPNDWEFVLIFAIFNIIGGYISNAAIMLGPKMVGDKIILIQENNCLIFSGDNEISGAGWNIATVWSGGRTGAGVTVWTVASYFVIDCRDNQFY